MGIHIGGGIGPFRGSVGGRGFGAGLGPIWVSSRTRRSSSDGYGGLFAIFLLLAVVGTAIFWAAIYWYISVPVLALITWAVVAGVRRSRRKRALVVMREQERLDERVRVAQGKAAVSIEALKQEIEAIRPQLGEDFDDFVRAAHFVITEQRAGRDFVRIGLRVSGRRAAELLSLLEQAGIVSAPRGSHRDILPIELADCYAPYLDAAGTTSA